MEWTSEGGLNRASAVGADGDLTRYQQGAHDGACKVDRCINLGGTAGVWLLSHCRGRSFFFCPAITRQNGHPQA